MKTKLYLSLAAAFVLGLACGILVTGAGVQRHVARVLQKGPDELNRIAVERIARKLRLDPDQKEKMQPIAERTRVRLNALRNSVAPELDATFRDAAAELKTFLRPDQIRTLDELMAEREVFWTRE